ncbi:hypothetical protein [Devosia ureilytica]|nr:hypothetical protein [Devosia ureilytica]
MPMSNIVMLTAVFAMFGAFSFALAYAQLQTRGMVAPGARPMD